jgi:hypothetical protein
VIPLCTEVVLPARAKNYLAHGDNMVENELIAPCRTLMIARALVDPSRGTFACRMLNPTYAPMTLREGTPVGVLVPITPEAVADDKLTVVAAGIMAPAGAATTIDAAPPIGVMRKDLEAKGISLVDTASQGQEIEKLIRLLYANMDIMATSVAELSRTDITRHRIETSEIPPIEK